MNIFPINILLVVVVVVVVIIVIAVSCDPWRMGGRRVQIKVEFIALALSRSAAKKEAKGNNFLISTTLGTFAVKGREGKGRRRGT